MLGRSSAIDDSVADRRCAPHYSPVCSRYSSGPSSSSRSAREAGRRRRSQPSPYGSEFTSVGSLARSRLMSTTTPPIGAKSSDTASSASMVPKTSSRENFSSRAGSSTKMVSPSSCCPYAVRPIVTSSSVQPTQRCSSEYRSSSGTRLTGASGRGVQGAPDFVDAFLQRGHVAIVVDDEIRPRTLELGGHLGGDHVHGLGLPERPLPREPLEPK